MTRTTNKKKDATNHIIMQFVLSRIHLKGMIILKYLYNVIYYDTSLVVQFFMYDRHVFSLNDLTVYFRKQGSIYLAFFFIEKVDTVKFTSYGIITVYKLLNWLRHLPIIILKNIAITKVDKGNIVIT